MEKENRKSPRYEEIGRIFAPELCTLPGILDDISVTGCKLHYSFPVVVDLENEYEIKIQPLHNSDNNPLNLICVPQWVKEQHGNTFIGFKILYSPDASRLNDFIQHLQNLSKNDIPDII